MSNLPSLAGLTNLYEVHEQQDCVRQTNTKTSSKPTSPAYTSTLEYM